LLLNKHLGYYLGSSQLQWLLAMFSSKKEDKSPKKPSAPHFGHSSGPHCPCHGSLEMEDALLTYQGNMVGRPGTGRCDKHSRKRREKGAQGDPELRASSAGPEVGSVLCIWPHSPSLFPTSTTCSTAAFLVPCQPHLLAHPSLCVLLSPSMPRGGSREQQTCLNQLLTIASPAPQ
jgi:hypothetical protein